MSKHSPGVPVNILMIEQQPDHVRTIGRVIKKSGIVNCLHSVSDGVEAINYLRKEAPYQKVPIPHLILLDVSLPNSNSSQVLAELKAESLLRRIPVVILASTEAECEFARRNFTEFVVCIIKPIDENRLLPIVTSISEANGVKGDR